MATTVNRCLRIVHCLRVGNSSLGGATPLMASAGASESLILQDEHLKLRLS
ncbi:hypothetical protein [Synechococcus sp. MIT S9510]|uniref:hypothetical protein n=1 Tax=unclassified Synechococcus TaxID=2626047 RepID=UPI0039B0B3F4